MTPTRFPIVLLKPLGHRSPLQRREWDSNPRTPCGRHGLANRSLGPLGHPSESNTRAGRRSSPPDHVPLPLQGSNLDSPDPESGVLPVTPRGTESPFPIAGFIPPRAGSCSYRSGRRGSNPRPSAWEADALPTELLPQSQPHLRRKATERALRTDLTRSAPTAREELSYSRRISRTSIAKPLSARSLPNLPDQPRPREELSYSRRISRTSVAKPLPQCRRPIPNLADGGQPGQSHRSDLNRRPLDYESSALPLSYGGAGQVEPRGIEPLTSAVRLQRSPS
jgi:hypothetical protein